MALLSAAPLASRPQHLREIAAGQSASSPELAGLAVVVASRDHLRRAEAYGQRRMSPRQRLRPDTVMRVASISKLTVAIVVMRLVEAGSLDLDRDVSDYLGWRVRNPAFPDAPVTLRQLLSHTSGIDDGPGYSLTYGSTLRTHLPEHWSAFRPGARFSYANFNFGIIASVMEAATATRFDQLMRRELFIPLQIDACFNWSGCSNAAVAKAATLYRKGVDEEHWLPDGPWVAQVDDLHGQMPCPVRVAANCDLGAYRPGDNGTLFSPQGGLRISALGLAKLGQMLLGQGQVAGVRILKPQSVAQMLTPVWQGGPPIGDSYDGLMQCWGVGVQCLTGGADQPVAGKSLQLWGHLGEAYGLYGGLWIDPENDRAYVYLITGTADDPVHYPGNHSKFTAFEEAVMAELVR